ncbi:MAG: hypothetical protein ACI90V_010617, partial [Bacillariaceae sp.]
DVVVVIVIGMVPPRSHSSLDDSKLRNKEKKRTAS